MIDFEDFVECVDPGSLLTLLALIVMGGGAWFVWRAQQRFQNGIQGLSNTLSACRLSGRAVARRLLDDCGLTEVRVVRSTDMDRYDHKSREVRLAPENYQGAGISALAIAAHEVGHAQQFTSGTPFWATSVVRHAAWGLAIAACSLVVLGFTVVPLGVAVTLVVVLALASAALQTAVVLPREIGASRRGRALAQAAGLLATPHETALFDRVLRNAWWTYVSVMGYRWTGVVAVAVALFFVARSEALLDEPPWINSQLAVDDPRLLQDLAEADAFAPTQAAADTATNHTASQSVTFAPPSTMPHGATSPEFAPGGEWAAPPGVPQSQPDYSFQLLMLAMSCFEWLGIIGIVSVFLALGFLQKKWLAPQQAIKRNQAGMKLFARAKYDRAIHEFTKALKLDPRLTAAYHNRATAYRNLGRQDDALADFEDALRLTPGLVDAIVARGEILFQRGDHDRAMADFNEALRLAPECASALSLRGCVWMDRQDLAQAFDDFTQSIEFESEEPLPYWGRGMVRLHKDDFNEALDDFDAALVRNAEFCPALRDRGLTRHLMGNHEPAIADLDEAIRLCPEDALAWNNRGAARLKIGQYAEALADLQEAIRLAPQLPNSPRHLAWLQATCPEAEYRDGEQAVANASRSLELGDSKTADVLAALAAAHAELGDFETAVDWQTKCIEQSLPGEKAAACERLALYQARNPFRDQPVSCEPATAACSCTATAPIDDLLPLA